MKALKLFLLFVLCLTNPALAQTASDLAALRLIPVQDGGRIKPLDTVARESVRFITGASRFQDEDPLWTSLRWLADPAQAAREKSIECRNVELKRSLHLDAQQRWFALEELRKNPIVQERLTALEEKKKLSKPAFSTAEKEFRQIADRMELEMALLDGQLWRIVPNSEGMEQTWLGLDDLYSGKSDGPQASVVVAALKDLLQGAHDKNFSMLRSASEKISVALAAMGPTPALCRMAMEVHYNEFHPFRLAWVLYLLGFVVLLFSPMRGSRGYWLGAAGTAFGLLFQVYGFYLRCSIAGRPPVTNMYESVIWVAFGAVLFACAFEIFYRTRVFLLAATAFSVVALILADNLPAVLDSSLKPLTPVLRNNFWLTVHVLTITMSYAAFALALGLGHMAAWSKVFQPNAKQKFAYLNQALYKAIQLGVLLLAAGTILGGVWANYSWGRFWGWDPKEVWALIALLGYLALLHGRYAGWVGGFGLAAGSIVAFMGVIMAWYGVNFILGVGLHSYGFGTGGLGYMAAYVSSEFILVAYLTVRFRRTKSCL